MQKDNAKSRIGHLIKISSIAAAGGFLFGYDTAVISGTLSMVQKQFGLNPAMEGWFVSSALIGCIIGVSGAGWMSDRFGRKRILLLTGLLFSLSAMGCAVSGSFDTLVIFRFIGGMGVGIASMISPLYISEVAPSRIRGRLVALYQLAITVGILSAYLINKGLLNFALGNTEHQIQLVETVFMTEVWRAMLGMEALPALTFFILVFMLPESPRWLVLKNQEKRAHAIFSRLTGEKQASEEILSVKEILKMETTSASLILERGILVAVFLGVSLAVLAQFTGIDAIVYYGPRILEAAGFNLKDALSGQILIGIVIVVFTLLAIWKIDKIGRRPLLLFGTSGMLASLSGIAILFALGLAEGILLLMFILVFIACFSFSLGPVVWVVLSEIYPTRIRGRAMSIATVSTWIATSIIGQMIPIMLDGIGPSFTFWIFAAFCLPALYIGWRILPETKGQSLEQIEQHWLNYGKQR